MNRVRSRIRQNLGGGCKEVNDYGQAIAHDAVAIFVIVRACAMVSTMEATFAPTLTHKDAVVVVGTKLGTEEFAEVRNHVGVVKRGVPIVFGEYAVSDIQVFSRQSQGGLHGSGKQALFNTEL